MTDIIPPDGYILMNVGEYPDRKNGDLVLSLNSCQRWDLTTMNGSWKIYSIPTVESLVYCRKDN